MIHGWLNPWVWGNHRYGVLVLSFTGIFNCLEGQCSNPHVVQGSTVYFILKDTYLNQWKNRVLPLEQYKNALYYHTRGTSQCNHTGKKKKN